MTIRKSTWIDVSIPLTSGMHSWPGDPAFKNKPHAALAKGDVCNVSALSMCTHTGTHMDSPWHFLNKIGTMDDLPFDAVIGPCRVVKIHDLESIKPAELAKLKLKNGERILFQTHNSKLSWKKPTFDKNFVYISKEAAQYLVDKKIRTVGIDYLSVGGFYQDSLPTHHILLSKKVWIIEGLNLSKIKPGRYHMICLPIRIAGGDGAPCRCILRSY